jgi:hypothetical protein
MQVIKNYLEVEVLPNALIIFDIDDTLIRFPNLGKVWWNTKMNHFLEEMNGDSVKARNKTLTSWINHISLEIPEHINSESFSRFITRAKDRNCHIIFLTARDSKIAHLTELHLGICGIEFESADLYHNEDKANALLHILEEPRFETKEHIIVIDDMLHNLENIRNNLIDYHLYLYKFGDDDL